MADFIVRYKTNEVAHNRIYWTHVLVHLLAARCWSFAFCIGAKMISPDQVKARTNRGIPEFVYVAVDELLCLHWDGERAAFSREEVIRRICDRWSDEITKGSYSTGDLDYERRMIPSIHAQKWLNFEPKYEQIGWKVTFVDSIFTFRDANVEQKAKERSESQIQASKAAC